MGRKQGCQLKRMFPLSLWATGQLLWVCTITAYFPCKHSWRYMRFVSVYKLITAKQITKQNIWMNSNKIKSYMNQQKKYLVFSIGWDLLHLLCFVRKFLVLFTLHLKTWVFFSQVPPEGRVPISVPFQSHVKTNFVFLSKGCFILRHLWRKALYKYYIL